MTVHPDRLRSSLQSAATSEPDPSLPPWRAPDRLPVSSAARPLGWRRILAFTQRAISHVATAALLLLTLALGVVAIVQQPPERPQWTPALVRALAAAPGNVVDVALVEAIFGLDQLPPGDKEIIFYRLTLPPGETLTALAGPSCGCPGWPVSGGVGAEVVQSGHYRVRFAAPIQVQRRGAAQIASIPELTEVALGPGDAAIYPHYAATAEIRAVGDAPVVLVGVAIIGREPSGAPAPMLPQGVLGVELSRSIPSDWEKLAHGPIGMSIRQVTLPAGTRIGPYEPIGLETMRVERGAIARYYFAPGAAAPTGQSMNWGEGAATPLLGVHPGMRYDMTSGADEPAELLVLILEPTGITAETLAP
jgi:hypothetical protein